MNLKNVKRDPVCSQKRSVIYRIHIPVLFLLLLFYDKVHPGSVETPELSAAELCLLQWLIQEGGKKFPSIPCLGVHFCWRLECCSIGNRAGDNFSRAQQSSSVPAGAFWGCPKRGVFSSTSHSWQVHPAWFPRLCANVLCKPEGTSWTLSHISAWLHMDLVIILIKTRIVWY